MSQAINNKLISGILKIKKNKKIFKFSVPRKNTGKNKKTHKKIKNEIYFPTKKNKKLKKIKIK